MMPLTVAHHICIIMCNRTRAGAYRNIAMTENSKRTRDSESRRLVQGGIPKALKLAPEHRKLRPIPVSGSGFRGFVSANLYELESYSKQSGTAQGTGLSSLNVRRRKAFLLLNQPRGHMKNDIKGEVPYGTDE